jgi:HlyD family secretion protein
MNSRKVLTYLGIAVLVLIVFVVVGKKAGFLGKSVTYDVITEKASLRTITESITANGKIQPQTEVKITPDVSGEIVELAVKDGDYVHKGQFLLKIKPDNYISGRDRAEAALNAAKAMLANTKAMLAQVDARFEQSGQAFSRSKKLWDDKAISLSEWETTQSSFNVTKAEVDAARQNVASAEFSVQSAEATLKEARENLIKTSISAPMDGTVTLLAIEKGERVVGTEMMSGTEMLRIADLNRMEVVTEVNENDIVRVSLNDSALVEVDAYPDRKFKGMVSEIANSATSTGLTADQVTNFVVKILLLKESYQDLIDKGNPQPFRPGMSASVDILTETKVNIVTIPVQAVTLKADSLLKSDSVLTGTASDEPKEIVFVYDNGKALTTIVTSGIQDKDYIEIKSGLKEGTEIVVAPYNMITKKLKNGAALNKVTKKEMNKQQ